VRPVEVVVPVVWFSVGQGGGHAEEQLIRDSIDGGAFLVPPDPSARSIPPAGHVLEDLHSRLEVLWLLGDVVCIYPA
jgi:hypothetical protein